MASIIPNNFEANFFEVPPVPTNQNPFALKNAYLLLAAGLLFSTILMAQAPTVTADTRVLLGDGEPVQAFLDFSFNPGPAGPDQTWDFGNIGEGDLSYDWSPQDPAETPFQDAFPAANLAFQVPPGAQNDTTEAYIYYELTDAGEVLLLGTVGLIVGQDTFFQIYQDPYLSAKFPITYQDEFRDRFSTETTIEADTSSIRILTLGDLTMTGDAYGTLITPAGTFENVLRVRLDEVRRDSFIDLPVPIPAMVSQEVTYYYWYAPGEAYILMEMQENRLFSAGIPLLTTSSAFYRDRGPGTTATENRTLLSADLQVWPNPAVEEISLSLDLETSSTGVVQLFSATGREVRRLPRQQFNVGENVLRLGVNQLPAGTYYLVVNTSAGFVREKVILR
jgi:hypothetical protein